MMTTRIRIRRRIYVSSVITEPAPLHQPIAQPNTASSNILDNYNDIFNLFNFTRSIHGNVLPVSILTYLILLYSHDIIIYNILHHLFLPTTMYDLYYLNRYTVCLTFEGGDLRERSDCENPLLLFAG